MQDKLKNKENWQYYSRIYKYTTNYKENVMKLVGK